MECYWNSTRYGLSKTSVQPADDQTCRDKKLRLFDPRAGAEAVRITDGHGGIKGSRVVFLGDRDRIATTGVSLCVCWQSVSSQFAV